MVSHMQLFKCRRLNQHLPSGNAYICR